MKLLTITTTIAALVVASPAVASADDSDISLEIVEMCAEDYDPLITFNIINASSKPVPYRGAASHALFFTGTAEPGNNHATIHRGHSATSLFVTNDDGDFFKRLRWNPETACALPASVDPAPTATKSTQTTPITEPATVAPDTAVLRLIAGLTTMLPT